MYPATCIRQHMYPDTIQKVACPGYMIPGNMCNAWCKRGIVVTFNRRLNDTIIVFFQLSLHFYVAT